MTVKKVCEHCKNKFIAQKTTTRFCSKNCGSRANKKTIRELKIRVSNEDLRIKTVTASPNVMEIQQKQIIDIQEACILLMCSESTLRKSIANGLLPTMRIGRKHLIRKSDIDNQFQFAKK